MTWNVVIGLEVHTQLKTHSKIFSSASTAFGAAPNSQASPVDMALPGVLPVMNAAALDCAIALGLAVGATVNSQSQFARKNYFYPDSPKAYQISQFDAPVVSGGELTVEVNGTLKTIRLTRAHLEEDAGKSLHENFIGQSGIDLNRAGTPLLEIVSEADMQSSDEAVAYAKALHGLVVWLGICDGNMQEGSFRMDANVSIHKPNAPWGTRREIKNLNSFRFLKEAIESEIAYQKEVLEDGGKIIQATVLFDADTGETRSMRSKEDAHDYRYFSDPDLPPLVITDERFARVKASLPELPAAIQARLQAQGISVIDSLNLTQSRAMASYTDEVIRLSAQPKLAANWVLGEISAQLNRDEKSIEQCPVSAAQVAQLISRIQDGTISHKIAKDIFNQLWAAPSADDHAVDAVITRDGLKQITDTGAIEALIDEVLAANAQSVAEYKAGKEKAFNALVGQCMKATKGKASPAVVNALLKAKLSA